MIKLLLNEDQAYLLCNVLQGMCESAENGMVNEVGQNLDGNVIKDEIKMLRGMVVALGTVLEGK